MSPVELVAPTPRLFESFSASAREWGDAHQDGAGLRAELPVTTREGFEAWVAALLAEETEPAIPRRVTCTYRWMVRDDEYLGSIALRHSLSPYLLERGGHIGYGVRPSARGQGVARTALAAMLRVAAERGLDRVLLTCSDHNIASRRTIEGAGGVLEDIREFDGERVRRYWIG